MYLFACWAAGSYHRYPQGSQGILFLEAFRCFISSNLHWHKWWYIAHANSEANCKGTCKRLLANSWNFDMISKKYSYVELVNVPSAKGANVWRSYSASSGTKKAGRLREIGPCALAFRVLEALSKKRPVCCCRRCIFMFHVGQEAWACVQLQTVQTMTWENQLAGRLATFRFGL